jgi:tetratricopeptide (TPR) repeat protein
MNQWSTKLNMKQGIISQIHSSVLRKRNHFLGIVFLIPTLFLTGCFTTSVYKFQSQPPEASVYYVNGPDKTLVGQTPIDYSKTALPSDAPFTILFEKAGYESREVSISPTDNSQTTISANLKVAKQALGDATTKRVRELLKKIFQIQEFTAQSRYVDALALINKAAEEEPDVAEIFVLKGSVYYLLNDHKQAKLAWQEALKIDSTLDQLRQRIKSIDANDKGASP